MALEPETTGAGRRPGHRSASDEPPAASVAIAPAPPPENDTASPGTAAADSDPSELRRSVVLTGVQLAPLRTRTGSTYSVSDSRPSGSAATVVVAVVRLPMATGLPEVRACCAAAAVAAVGLAEPLAPITAPVSGWAGVAGSG